MDTTQPVIGRGGKGSTSAAQFNGRVNVENLNR